jgi:autotransporter-associated beta strand protein
MLFSKSGVRVDTRPGLLPLLGVVAALAIAAPQAAAQTIRTFTGTNNQGTPVSRWFRWDRGLTWSDNTAPNATSIAFIPDPAINTTTSGSITSIIEDGPSQALGIQVAYSGTFNLVATNANRVLTLGTNGITLESTAGLFRIGADDSGGRLGPIINLVSGTQTWRNDSATGRLFVSTAITRARIDTVSTATNGTVLRIAGSGPIDIRQPITGSSSREISIVKEDSGLLTLWQVAGNDPSTFAGGFTLRSGTVALNYPQALGRSTFTIESGTLINTSGSAVTLSQTNAQVWNGNFGFRGVNALNLGTGMVTLGAAPTVTVASSTLTVGGTITGGFGLTKAGEGTLRLTAASNTFSGTTRIDAGILDVNNVNSALRNTVVDLSGSGTLANFGTAPVFGGLLNYSGLTLPGTVTRLTLNPQEGQIQTYDVLPGGGTATIGLTKSGPGTMIFNGTSSWTGVTRIEGGVLQVEWLANAGLASPLGTSGTLQLGTGTSVGTLRSARRQRLRPRVVPRWRDRSRGHHAHAFGLEHRSELHHIGHRVERHEDGPGHVGLRYEQLHGAAHGRAGHDRGRDQCPRRQWHVERARQGERADSGGRPGKRLRHRGSARGQWRDDRPGDRGGRARLRRPGGGLGRQRGGHRHVRRRLRLPPRPRRDLGRGSGR